MPAGNSQELPVILIRDHDGNVIEKISVKEWLRRKALPQNENFEIKLYREALNYYAIDEMDKAEDLLLYLCELSDYTHYEYVERVANIYRRENRPDKERCVLLLAYRKLRLDPVAARIDRRLEKLDRAFLPKTPFMNQAIIGN